VILGHLLYPFNGWMVVLAILDDIVRARSTVPIGGGDELVAFVLARTCAAIPAWRFEQLRDPRRNRFREAS